MISAKNIEYYILSYIDGELSHDEEKALHEYLRQNPDYQDMLEEYQSLKIEKPTTVYAQKGQLIKKEKPIALIWRAVAAAAVLIALVVLFAVPEDRPQTQVAAHKQPKSKSSAPQITARDSLSLVHQNPSSKAASQPKVNNRAVAALPKYQPAKKSSSNRDDSNPSKNEQKIASAIARVYSLNPISSLEISESNLPIAYHKTSKFETYSYVSSELESHKNYKSIASFQLRNTRSLKKAIVQIHNIVSAYQSFEKDSADYSLVINLNNFLKL